MVELFESVQPCCLGGGDRRDALVAGVLDRLCRLCGIGVLRRLIAVLADILRTLRQRLRMADDRFDVLDAGPGHAQQMVVDPEGIQAVDIQRALEHQIHHLTDLAGVAVLDGQHTAVAFSPLHRLIRGAEIAVGDLLAVGEDLLGGDIGIRALDAAVGDLHATDDMLLILLGHRHLILQKSHIIRADVIIVDIRGVLLDHRLLALCVIDLQAAFLLILGDRLRRLHTAFKQRRHLLVDLIDLHPRIL